MGTTFDRKEAIKEYKARKLPRGAYAVRCTVTGQVWVGSSRDLNAARNGLWFTLRIGSHRERTLQAAWSTHGEQAFEYEILEKLDEDVCALAVHDLLKEMKLRWVERLGAGALL